MFCAPLVSETARNVYNLYWASNVSKHNIINAIPTTSESGVLGPWGHWSRVPETGRIRNLTLYTSQPTEYQGIILKPKISKFKSTFEYIFVYNI